MEDVAEDSGGEDGEGEMDPESSDVVLTPLREDAAMVFTQHKGELTFDLPAPPLLGCVVCRVCVLHKCGH